MTPDDESIESESIRSSSRINLYDPVPFINYNDSLLHINQDLLMGNRNQIKEKIPGYCIDENESGHSK